MSRTTEIVKLGDVVEILSGFPFNSIHFSTDGELPVVRIRDVNRGFSSTYYNGSYDSKFLVSDGDILVGMDGEFNRGRWSGGKALLNQRVCRLAPVDNEIIDHSYLFHFLPKALKLIEDATPFVTVKHLSVKSIRAIEICLPTVFEQRRIAATLNSIEVLRTKRREALAKLDDLTQSVFVDMFGGMSDGNNKWPINPLGELARVVRGASPRPKGDPRYFGGDIPWLMISDVTRSVGQVVEQIRETVTEEGRGKSVYLPSGTLILTNSATVGVPKFLGESACIHDGFLAFLQVDPKLNLQYL